MKRTRIRRAAQFASLLAFPATIYYMSPVLPLEGAPRGIITGSLLLFLLLFVTAPLFGRSFCAWLCPAGGIGDLAARARNRPVQRNRLHWVKYVIWLPWLLGLAALLVRAGGVTAVEPTYATRMGLSVADLPALIVYLAVVSLFLGLSLLIGRRAGCHTVCWMAPFMVLGRLGGTRLGVPGLRLASDSSGCVGCTACTESCAMSLPVDTMVSTGKTEHIDCILCGQCVDACPKQCLSLEWAARPRWRLQTAEVNDRKTYRRG